MSLRAISSAKKGFTAFEFVIVLAITLLLAVLATPLYSNVYRGAQLDEYADQLAATLRQARERSAARAGGMTYGVHFDTNRFTLWGSPSASPAFANRDPSIDQITVLPSALTQSSNFSLGDVYFSKGLGVPQAAGLVTLAHSTGGTLAVSVNVLGVVQIQ